MRVELRSFSSYRTPTPSFDVALEGSVIRLSQRRPEAASRCVCPHDLALLVNGVRPGTYTVRIDRSASMPNAAPLESAAVTVAAR